jgi:hypothetical protein
MKKSCIEMIIRNNINQKKEARMGVVQIENHGHLKHHAINI